MHREWGLPAKEGFDRFEYFPNSASDFVSPHPVHTRMIEALY
jgi:hypothetical protein